MDDQGKLRIRAEFKARFWRLLIVIVLLSGFLIWHWFSDPKFNHYLWLAVLPWIFLIPFLRYHQALRALTQVEPSSSEALPPSVLISDAVRARIRRDAGIVHWIVQALLILLIAVGIISRVTFRFVADSFSNLQLTRPGSVIMSEFGRFYFGRGQELIPLSPPANPEDRLAWAQNIEQRLGQPVAVFIKEGASLVWITRNDSLAEGVAAVPHLFDPNLTSHELGAIDTIGVYEVRRVSGLPPEDRHSAAWIVGPLDRDLRWGVVLDFDETWIPFFDHLKRAERESPQMDSPAWAIKEVIYLGGTDDTYKARLRVLDNGQVLYSSPDLDTTRHVYAHDIGSMRWEYYQSEMDKRYAGFLAKGPVTWRHYVAWAVLMFGFYWLYRWIRKLTAPTASIS